VCVKDENVIVILSEVQGSVVEVVIKLII
jgi:hypothetical protein